MKIYTASIEMIANVILYGYIIMAKYDFSGTGSYALNASIGAAIWMVFKLLADFLSTKFIKKVKSKSQELNTDDLEN